jgi:acyl-CoA synthetase (NDP forming)
MRDHPLDVFFKPESVAIIGASEKEKSIGLAVVHGIIAEHQGVIKVHSVVGRGNSFTVRLSAYKPGEANVAP